MRITSNILGNLAGALKRSLVGIYETDITIPPTVIPGFVPRETLHQFNPGINTVMSTSFHTSGGQRVANAALATGTLCILDLGLWELDIAIRYSANYASGLNGGQLNALSQAFTGALFDLATEVALGGDIFLDRRFLVNLDTQLVLSTSLAANGVGQAHMIEAFVMASKVL